MVGRRIKVSPCLSKTGERRLTLSDLMWSKITNRSRRSRILSIAPKLLVMVTDTASNRSKFNESWTKFCDNSTLDGLHLVGGTRNAHQYKISALMLFMAMLLAGDLCYDSLSLYLRYKLRTTISYKTNAELPFPALTFCNINMFKKSVTGTDEIFTRALTFLYAKNRDELPIIMEQNNVTCRAVEINQVEFLYYMGIIFDANNNKDMKAIFQTFGQIAKDMVKKCWWNKNEIDCNKQFVNHMLDFSICFTFNQNSSDLDSTASVVPVFGMEDVPFTPRIVSNPQHGLQLLLDTQQQEYCGSPIIRSGAGFRLLIHDTHAQTSLDLLPAISLSPGFEYTVTMQPVTYDMRNFSESLGRCTSYVYNPMRPESDYDQPSCFMECFALKIWKSCKCVPIQTRLITDTLIKYVGETTSSTRMRMCDPFRLNDLSDSFCVMDTYSQFRSSAPNEFCPSCIRKCFETKYEYKLSAKRLLRSQQVDNGTNGSQHNLVMVTFNFDSMTSMKIMETQLFTLTDLCIYWGNTLGLFLGFSFVTLYEVFHQLVYSIHILCKSKKHSLKFMMAMFKVFRRGEKIKKRKRSRQPSILFS